MAHDCRHHHLKLDLPQELNCDICGRQFTDPRVAPCGHSFCAGCIAGLRTADATCPACGAPLERTPGPSNGTLPRNLSLAGILDHFRETEDDRVAHLEDALAEVEAKAGALLGAKRAWQRAKETLEALAEAAGARSASLAEAAERRAETAQKARERLAAALVAKAADGNAAEFDRLLTLAEVNARNHPYELQPCQMETLRQLTESFSQFLTSMAPERPPPPYASRLCPPDAGEGRAEPSAPPASCPSSRAPSPRPQDANVDVTPTMKVRHHFQSFRRILPGGRSKKSRGPHA